MSALTRAETEWTQWRLDGTLPGISAKIEDGAGRAIGLWIGAPGWGYTGRRVTVYAHGRNHRTNFAVDLDPADARRLAASLEAMAAHLELSAQEPTA